jgi:hypothetical protein
MIKQAFHKVKGRVRRTLRRATGRSSFSHSATYWQERYGTGGTSGAGSYGRLAEFKAGFINDFVRLNDIGSVIEFGSGDGGQLALAQYPRYLGVDVSSIAIEACRRRYKDRPGYRFEHISKYEPETRADLAMSLDVIFHLVEDAVYEEYMERLFEAAARFVIIYSSNYESEQLYHVKHRKFTDWIDRNQPGFERIAFQHNPYPFDPEDPDNTSFADFYAYRRSGA